MKYLDNQTIIKLSEIMGKTIGKSMSLAMRGVYDLDSWLDILNCRAKAAGFKFQKINSDDKIKIIVNHNMGQKWSLWYKHFYTSVIHDLGYKVDFETTNDVVVYTVFNNKT
ncbi:hypothetical protein AAA799P11_00936 [Marine Group I thaumarchaeote SCGC AAA799-P11]|uniref:Uncharacterized protein n=1 Tax=Marine Group I thaumarchaeote SCGC AAA799-P11 TaxID=1502295 RepID=A0A087RZB1_9ARCH|nr:hypothetical protein AAA799P11_00936 [Marine Group I thaumarchaeote SCGC AAA799-P11]